MKYPNRRTQRTLRKNNGVKVKRISRQQTNPQSKDLKSNCGMETTSTVLEARLLSDCRWKESRRASSQDMQSQRAGEEEPCETETSVFK
jgi:DNA-directed RNA polymerase specialized sigma subunit